MEGPHDPQHPGQDAGAPQPEAQDGDLHALLERLLGQGDVRPSAPGAGDDLWPDLFAAAPAADEVSTIVPAPDAPADVAELPTVVEEPAVEAGLEAGAAREWEPVVVDVPATTTNVDDIHAAILASVSVDLEPIVAEPEPEPELDLSRYLLTEPEPPTAGRLGSAVARRAARGRAGGDADDRRADRAPRRGAHDRRRHGAGRTGRRRRRRRAGRGRVHADAVRGDRGRRRRAGPGRRRALGRGRAGARPRRRAAARARRRRGPR